MQVCTLAPLQMCIIDVSAAPYTAPQFIEAMGRTPAEITIVRAMIGLAHIAEGVETDRQ